MDFKKNIKISFFITVIFFFLNSSSLFAQCSVEIFASSDSITCGDSIVLTAYGNTGNFVLNNDFNDGTVGTGWSSTSSAMFTNPCGFALDSATYLWFGDSTPHPRSLTTVALDLSLGGNICFDLKFGTQGDPDPCEGPDEPDEGVILEYSIDGGNTWEPIHYFHPDGGYNPVLTQWNNYCFNIPFDAMTPNTLVRWEQISTSGAAFDHWGLNNIEIVLIDPDYFYVWDHDGTLGQETSILQPMNDTSFTVFLTNNINDTCSATINIDVSPPEFITSIAPTDTSTCPGDCVEINASAEILVSPESQPTFTNNYTQVVSGFFGNPVTETVPMAVGGLNMTTIEPGSIESVCFYIQNANHLTVSLVCPDGVELLLTESATGGSFGDSTGNVSCFTLDATQTISQDSPHYTGNYLPDNNGSLDDLVGCSAEGLWQLQVVSTHPLLGIHMLNNWSITFNDPEIIIPALFHWEPTTNMTGSSNLTPTVCPTQGTTYTLYVYDAHGCDTTSLDFTVNIDPSCCDIEIDDIIVEDPACNVNDGTITINTSGGNGPNEYSIDNGTTFQSNNTFTGLSAGVYEVLARDADLCFTSVDTVVLNIPDVPEIQLNQLAHTTCDFENGLIEISSTGGTGNIEYSIDFGITFQNDPLFQDLNAGNYILIAQDDESCLSDTLQVEILPSTSPDLQIDDISHPTCLLNDGQTIVSTTSGSGNVEYSIDNGVSFQSNNIFDNLAPGSFEIFAIDDDNCSSDTLSFTLNAPVSPEIVVDTLIQPSCGLNDGEISVFAINGTEPYSFLWSDGQSSSIVTGLGSGNHTVIVTDSLFCSDTLDISLTDFNQPVVNDINLEVIETPCGLAEGEITGITVSGSSPFLFEWVDSLGNTVSSSSNNADVIDLEKGLYTLFITDDEGCETVYGPVQLEDMGLPFITDTVVLQPQSCENPDGFISVDVSGGTGDYTYIWSHDANLNAPQAENLSSGSYSVTIEDVGGSDCSVEKTFSLSNANDVVIELSTENISCHGNADGSASVSVTEGVAPYQYFWSNGDTTETTENLNPGSYQIEVTDANQCVASLSFDIEEPDSLMLFSTITEPGCYEFSDGLIETEISGGTQPYQYGWSGFPDVNEANLTNIPAGNYELVVTDSKNCEITSDFILNSPLPGEAAIDASASSIVQYDSIELTALALSGLTPPLQYSWEPSSILDCDDCPVTGSAPMIDTDFIVTITDSEGCSASASVFIEVEELITSVYIPNAFSPNGDGVNDVFEVYGNGIKDLTLRVHDRWGVMVFESSGVNSSWDGTFNGRKLPVGVYVYTATIIFDDNKMKTKTGSITIVK
ncbi:MAG: hypothetical protein EA412_04980 [Chitinophagaceae bacterium]|nr:MAG: hypothetical protein EA412_04980 [Chitinophagaceae bacterium]